jgi:hypothetical protein
MLRVVKHLVYRRGNKQSRSRPEFNLSGRHGNGLVPWVLLKSQRRFQVILPEMQPGGSG